MKSFYVVCLQEYKANSYMKFDELIKNGVELSTQSNKAQMLVKDNFRLFNTMTDMGMNQPARSL